MLLSSRGNIASFAVAMLIPFYARVQLGAATYAMWVLLSTVAAVATTLDFGGSTLVGARIRVWHARQTYLRALALTVAGSLLVTAISCLLWSVLVHLGKAPATATAGYLAFALAGIAAVVRSAVNLDATVAVVAQQFGAQTRIYLAQALAQAALVVLLLEFRLSFWALPASNIIASSIVVASLWRWRHRQLAAMGGVSPLANRAVQSFAASRTVGGILLLAISQGDRWAVGAVAGKTMLATYDLAARVAAVPRFVIGAMGGVVIPQHVTARDSLGRLKALYRSAQRTGTVVLAGLSILILMGSGGLTAAHQLAPRELLLIVALVVGGAANALVVTGAMFVNAQLRAASEIPYLVLAVACFAAVTLLAIVLPGSPHGLVVLASPLGLIIGSGYFLYRHPWFPRASLRSVLDASATEGVRAPDDGHVSTDAPPFGILYVVGATGSDTTVLSQALREHPGVFSVGGVVNIWRAYLLASPCSCGKPVPSCEFWRPIFEELQHRFGVDAVRDAERSRISAFRLRRLRYGTAGGNIAASPELARYVRYYRELMGLVAEKSGASWIVDSSKTITGIPFAEIVGGRFKFLYMTRDPRAVAFSEHTQDWPGDARRGKARGHPVVLSAARWSVLDLLARKLLAAETAEAIATLRYEDFVNQPRGSLTKIAQWIGLAPHAWEWSQRAMLLRSGHIATGKPARHESGLIGISEHREWHHSLRGADRLAADTLTFGGRRRYGYR
jgi:hypothetical protein